MIIQHYEFSVRAGDVLVYDGETYFGFFHPDALAEQAGIRDAPACDADDNGKVTRPVVRDPRSAALSRPAAGGWLKTSRPWISRAAATGWAWLWVRRRSIPKRGSSRPTSCTIQSGLGHWGWNPFFNSLKSLQPNVGNSDRTRFLNRRRSAATIAGSIADRSCLPAGWSRHGPRSPTATTSAGESQPAGICWSTVKPSIK